MKKAILLTILLTACTVGPDYKKPDENLPASWNSAESIENTKIQADWWKNFHDPVLDQLIDKAAGSNYDLQIAEAKIAEARASRGFAKADLLPQVDAKASANRQGNRIAFPGGGGPGFDLTKPFNTFEAGFDASWEADLFGGKKRAVESASAEVEASEASRDDIKISLLAEVARSYMDIRHNQQQIANINDIIKSNQKTLDISNQLFKVGSVPKLDVAQAEARLSDSKSELPKYEAMLTNAEYAVDVLTSQQPGTTAKLVTETKPVPVADSDLVLSAPAKIIANRPDVKMAERELASATAEQGVAVAALFPDISISGFVGLLNVDAGDLLKSGSRSWSVGGGILAPILNFGRLSANIDAADARQQQALATYQKSILAALADVEQSVTSYKKEQEHYVQLKNTASLLSQAVGIAENRYEKGMTSYLEVLDAKRSLYEAQTDLNTSEAAVSQDLTAVYKSLGGGWVATEKTQ